MKKNILYWYMCLLVFFYAIPVFAEDVRTLFNDSLDATAKKTGHTGLKFFQGGALSSLGSIIQVLLSLIGVLFLIMTIWGGFIWMNSRGDEKEVTRAKDIIQNSLIGLIIIIAAYAITNFVGENLLKSVIK